jgi:hypothetical protein
MQVCTADTGERDVDLHVAGAGAEELDIQHPEVFVSP